MAVNGGGYLLDINPRLRLGFTAHINFQIPQTISRGRIRLYKRGHHKRVSALQQSFLIFKKEKMFLNCKLRREHMTCTAQKLLVTL